MDSRVTASHEMLLIRVGHHLWREFKSKSIRTWPKEALLVALETVWKAKEAVRVPLRAEHRASRERLAKSLEGHRFAKRA
jgi:hypothetical protein